MGEAPAGRGCARPHDREGSDQQGSVLHEERRTRLIGRFMRLGEAAGNREHRPRESEHRKDWRQVVCGPRPGGRIEAQEDATHAAAAVLDLRDWRRAALGAIDDFHARKPTEQPRLSGGQARGQARDDERGNEALHGRNLTHASRDRFKFYQSLTKKAAVMRVSELRKSGLKPSTGEPRAPPAPLPPPGGVTPPLPEKYGTLAYR